MADYIEAFRDIGSPGTLQSCLNCGRKFNDDTLQRHEVICSKLKKRKPFDSSKQRLEGVVPADCKTKPPDTSTPAKTKKNTWKQKHQDFINTIRSARGVTVALKKGDPLPPPPPATVNPDYVQCPHCSRRFNEHSAERHIDFCKEQKSRIGKSPAKNAAARVAARTQYKPPLPTKRNSTGPSSAGKTRQTLAKTTTIIKDEKPSSHENQPLPVKNQATKPQSANTPTKPGRQGRQQAVGTIASAGTRRETLAKTNDHDKAQYSNQYKKDNNYMQTLDNNEEEEPISNKTREVIRYGRRASTQRNGSLDDIPDAVDKQKPQSNTRRNITIRDPSPTLFDDFANSPKPPTTNTRNNPFPSKAQVHRPSTDTDGVKRLSKFCYECGTKYPVPHAKYCCECGTKRPYMDS